MFEKAWVVPWDENDSIGIAYEHFDGTKGFIRLDQGSGHRDLPSLMRLLSDQDLRLIETRHSNVIPFTRSG